MSQYVLTAQARQVFGRKVRTLRRQGLVPGNLFGKKSKSLALSLDHKALLKVMREAGETGLINLSVEGQSGTHPVLVAGYAKDPVTEELLHVDLHEVDLTVRTKANVPVKLVGESPAVVAGNVLVQQKNELEVEALPADLPEHLEVDITGLTEVGMSIVAQDIKVDRTKVTLEVGDDEVIVTIQEPAKEEVVAAPSPVEGEGEQAAPAAPKDDAAEPEPKKD